MLVRAVVGEGGPGSQIVLEALRQLGQVRQESTMQPTAARSPSLNFVTSLPTSSPGRRSRGPARRDKRCCCPFVAGLVNIGVADAAEENLDLHIGRQRIAAIDAATGKWRSGAGGRESSDLWHGRGVIARDAAASRLKARRWPGDRGSCGFTIPVAARAVYAGAQ